MTTTSKPIVIWGEEAGLNLMARHLRRLGARPIYIKIALMLRDGPLERSAVARALGGSSVLKAHLDRMEQDNIVDSSGIGRASLLWLIDENVVKIYEQTLQFLEAKERRHLDIAEGDLQLFAASDI